MGLREKNEEKTRALIKQKAFELFCAHGIEAADMKDIARAAEISRPTLYRYFETKHMLAERLYLENLNQMVTEYSEIDLTLDGYHLIETILDRLILLMREHPAWLVYDAMYNLYASRIHVDPTRLPEHPFNQYLGQELIGELREKLLDGTLRTFPDQDLVYEQLTLSYFAHIQRLAIFTTQKSAGDLEWLQEQAERAKLTFLRILSLD
ncbi:MAG: TetR/AcrR family transcriptional regulator [Anaerolineaceae bacterium]|nr:TetR/AcrR family transcriptional regulator [Anaerolineaceae bacterium]